MKLWSGKRSRRPAWTGPRRGWGSWCWPLSLEPTSAWSGAMTRQPRLTPGETWQRCHNPEITSIRRRVRCCFYCAIGPNYCRCKAICTNPMCIREWHRHPCHLNSQSAGFYRCRFTNQRLTLQGTVWSQNFLAVMRCPDCGIRLLNILEAANKNKADHNIW